MQEPAPHARRVCTCDSRVLLAGERHELLLRGWLRAAPAAHRPPRPVACNLLVARACVGSAQRHTQQLQPVGVSGVAILLGVRRSGLRAVDLLQLSVLVVSRALNRLQLLVALSNADVAQYVCYSKRQAREDQRGEPLEHALRCYLS